MMKRNGLLLAGFSAALLLGANQSIAQTTVTYDFASGSALGSVVGTDVSAGNATTGGDVALSASSGGVAFIRSDVTSEGLSNAITANDYLSVTLTGADYGISEITFNHSVSDTFDDADYTTHILVKEFGLTFVASDEVLDTTRTADGSPLPATPAASVDLSLDPAFQGLSGTTEIRVYFSDDVTNNGQIHLLDNLFITVVPEPSSLALVGLGGFFLLRRRRRD